MLDRFILFPYYLTLKLRHSMYDHGFIFKSVPSDIPTICIGNITAGGTGKTPHTEMILRMLKERYPDGGVAVLSRGYKRRKKGYQVLPENCSAAQYGDEPSQIKKKFPGTPVVVDKNRNRGCKNIAMFENPPQVIVLDDGLQYRALKPNLSILLVNSKRPVHTDRLLPFGMLRDLPERIKSADIVIVTKCSQYIEDSEKIQWACKLGLDLSNLYFTYLNYRPAESVFQEADKRYIYSKRAIMFSGVADDTPLRNYLSDDYQIVEHYKFADHHKFSQSDIHTLISAVKKWPTAAVLTTEKDARRIVDCRKIPQMLKERLFVIPVESDFVSNEERERFFKTIAGL